MDFDETGVDCGGCHCAPCPNCTDGIQNQNETGVDCGGPNCAICPNCTDGLQNGDETGTDCGGSCVPCPNCTDGILNNNETEVDCGGPNCDPCEHCLNCARDGDETAFNCGGASCAPCATTCNTSGGITCPPGAVFIQSPNPTQADGPCYCYCPRANFSQCGPEVAACENATRTANLVGSTISDMWPAGDNGYISSPCSDTPLFGPQCPEFFECDTGTSGGIQVILGDGCYCSSSNITACSIQTGTTCARVGYSCSSAVFCPCIEIL
jgi:hypothetical protein